MLCQVCGIREASYRGECKVCGYKKRNNENVYKVLSDGKWNQEEIDAVIFHMLCEKHDVVNDILPYIPEKTLDDLVNLLEFDMPIRGTAKNRILLNCASCGAQLVRPLKHYFMERVYCDFTCRDKYKTIHMSGVNSPFYNRVATTCANCGKEIFVIPFEFNCTNGEGEHNNFCSQECYYQYRSQHYSGEKHPMYGHQFSDEQRDESRKRLLRMIMDGTIPQTMTEPHIRVSELLTSVGIKHINEKPCKYYSIDIYLEDYNLMIEIMGDYWHASPLKYYYSNLSDVQKKDVGRDKAKHTYIKKYYGCEILYLWETDIKQDINLCLKLIDLYISHCGELDDYNSFNYHLQDDKIMLNDSIIYPFFITQNPYRLQGFIGNNIAEVVHL